MILQGIRRDSEFRPRSFTEPIRNFAIGRVGCTSNTGGIPRMSAFVADRDSLTWPAWEIACESSPGFPV